MSSTTPDTSERIAATQRPEGVAVMRQQWSDLLLLHWPLPVAELRPFVPDGLEIDVYEGRAWIGVVSFRVDGTRPGFFPPLPLISRFDGVNLRTYVHRAGRDPGIWFFSLDASSRLAVQAARALYKLPYRYAEIALDVQGGKGRPMQAERWIRFVSRRVRGDQPELEVRYRGADVPRPAEPGTLEHFLVERYVLYSRSAQGLHSARVHHRPCPLQPAVVEDLRERLTLAARLQRPQRDPIAHYASGLDVEIFRLKGAT